MGVGIAFVSKYSAAHHSIRSATRKIGAILPLPGTSTFLFLFYYFFLGQSWESFCQNRAESTRACTYASMATFTALNGGSPKALDIVNGGVASEMKRSGSEELPRTEAVAPRSQREPTNNKASRPADDVSPSRTAAAETDRERAKQNAAELDERERQRENRAGPASTVDRPRHPSTGFSDVDSGALKRKRSNSPDTRSTAEPAQPRNPLIEKRPNPRKVRRNLAPAHVIKAVSVPKRTTRRTQRPATRGGTGRSKA